MKRSTAILLTIIALPLAAQDRNQLYKQPTETQCKQMVDGMVQTMRTTPPPDKRDKDADALLARVEKEVADNRARGKSECDSWAFISKAVTTQ
ncbi:hypothetical protein BWI17_08295 [Betaproteobacteria bacterium GR16-43]|nr:hypothetical protein BWI17_08295 [Betaproteobacteria bacterium GR16-43]